jgi:hypothetical protein
MTVQNSSGSLTSRTTGSKEHHYTQHITHTQLYLPQIGQGHCGLGSLHAVHRTYLATLRKHGICVTAYTYLWLQTGL